MYLNFILLLILIGFALSGIGLSIYRLLPTFGNWYSMGLTKDEAKIEIRRVLTILFLFVFKMYFIHLVYRNFNWLLFILVSIISILVLFLIFILDSKSFYIGFKTGVYPKRNGLIFRLLKCLTVFKFKNRVTRKDISTNSEVKLDHTICDFSERTQNIEKVFTKSLFDILRQHDCIFLSDDYTYEEVKKIIISSEQQVLKFKNFKDAKQFYNIFFKHSKSSLEDYCNILGFKYNTLRKGVESDDVSNDFKCFLKSYKESKQK